MGTSDEVLEDRARAAGRKVLGEVIVLEEEYGPMEVDVDGFTGAERLAGLQLALASLEDPVFELDEIERRVERIREKVLERREQGVPMLQAWLRSYGEEVARVGRE